MLFLPSSIEFTCKLVCLVFLLETLIKTFSMPSRNVGQSSPTEVARKCEGIRISCIAVVCESCLLV